MKTRLIPIIAQLNTVIQERNGGFAPMVRMEAEALDLIERAKGLLIEARAKLQQADVRKR